MTTKPEKSRYYKEPLKPSPLNATYQKVVDWLEKYPKVSLDILGRSIHIKHNDFIRYPQELEELEKWEKGTLIHITDTPSGVVITGHHHYLAKLENGQPLPSQWLKTFIENITLYFVNDQAAQVDAEKQESNGEIVKKYPPRIERLNKLAVMWADYNQNSRISKAANMAWFLDTYAEEVVLGPVFVAEFKKHLPKAYKDGKIGKDKKTRRYIPIIPK